jgi:crotonobetainyl-CoA:carnitine CoA-transferase CaiB-like acyl-CoA transferase
VAQALDDIRILDLTSGIAGPLGVLMLAEHGADVIKVEPPGGHRGRTDPGSVVHDRSRRSVTLDLRTPEGVALFEELCTTADVVVEAFAPGTMATFGLGHAELLERHPRLVYCSIPAWPEGSRFARDAGYEALVHARSGQQWEQTGLRTGPIFLHSPVASHGAMLLVPVGIMAALTARRRTGRGQHVEVSLLQGVMSLTTQVWNWTDQGSFLMERLHPPGVHQGSIIECADGEWVHASTMSGIDQTSTEGEILGFEHRDQWTWQFMEAEDFEAWNAERIAAYKRWDRAELIAAFDAAGLGAEAIVAPHERFDHPQMHGTGAAVEVVDPDLGPTTQFGVPVFLAATPGAVKGPRPRPGADNDEVLGALGHDADELATLRHEGII